MTTATITPQVTRHPVPDADGLIFRDGYGPVHEVARIGDGGITGRVWRNVHRDDDGIHIEFDVTIDGIGGAPPTTASAATRSGCASWPPSPRPPPTSSRKRGRGNGIRSGVG